LGDTSSGVKVLLICKVLILGGNGMLGQMVFQFLSRSKEIIAEQTSREQENTPFHFDVKDGINKLRHILERNKPFDYLINCIGILNNEIDVQVSLSIRRAIHINALFPHDLAALSQEFGVRVIHISTDGVFVRNAGVCFEDNSLTCGDVYGKTKSLGEVVAPGFLNLRCSIIGPNVSKEQGLLEWFLRQPRGAEVKGYTNQMWNGVTTLQFAKLCEQLISLDLFDTVWEESSVHHFCPNREVSKYELLQMFRDICRPDMKVEQSKSLDMPVSRILDTQYKSLKKIFGDGYSMRQTIKEMATEMREEASHCSE
jgi:dTDP-4-dehydrorhamnose reductase